VKAALAGLLFVAVVTVPFSAALLPSGGPSGTRILATAHALDDIPGGMLALYQQAAAARCPGLPWSVLAAVGKVETDHARNVATSSAGARGPMQFMPGTWAAYGLDATGNGVADIMDAVDAVHSAAHYLCANGGGNPATLRKALWHYNHAEWYVNLVLERAAGYAVSVASAPPVSADGQALLANPHVILTPRARGDVAAGIVDPRVIAVLAAAAQRHTIAVSVMKSGHSRHVAGTNRISNHWCGQAADVFLVDGVPVSRASPQARIFVEWLRSLPEPVRPTEVGQPWPDLVGGGVFTDGSHQGHVHVGFGPRCTA
jgi:hypothetical protein